MAKHSGTNSAHKLRSAVTIAVVAAVGVLVAFAAFSSRNGGPTGQDGSSVEAAEPTSTERCFRAEALSSKSEFTGRAASPVDESPGYLLPLSADEARQVLAFSVAFPEVPTGWNSETELFNPFPAEPFYQCQLRVTLTDPSSIKVEEIPARTITAEDGTQATVPAYTRETASGARLTVRLQPEGDDLGNPGTGADRINRKTSINGHKAHVGGKISEQTVSVTWLIGDVVFSMDCDQISVDGCVALAESVN